ncbi:colicin 10 lysis protein, partial [Escherichia coli]|nr:colicin 10 lysis protein [Escherichia coli]
MKITFLIITILSLSGCQANY